LNASTSLTFTLNAVGVGNANVAFTDTLPAGLVVANPNGLTASCGGTVTAAPGSSTISLSGLNMGGSPYPAFCQYTVNVTGTTAGVKDNSYTVTWDQGASSGGPATASVTVIAPPTIGKQFGALSIPLNGSTTLTFTLQNNNTGDTLTGVGFSDTLPAGLSIATPNGLSGSCGGGTITATQGTNVVSLSGGSLAPATSCTFSIDVTGTSGGVKNNITGNVTSIEGGTGTTASANLTVVSPPSITKSFGAAQIALNGSTSLSFAINKRECGRHTERRRLHRQPPGRSRRRYAQRPDGNLRWRRHHRSCRQFERKPVRSEPSPAAHRATSALT
jgi:hypothetical protein